MKRLRALASDVRGGLTELARPGESTLSGYALWRLGAVALSAALVIANLIGTVAVFLVALFIVPEPKVAHQGHVDLVNAIAALIYFPLASLAGVLLGTRGLFSEIRSWLMAERPATDRERRIILRAPIRVFVVQVMLWLGAAIVFGALNAVYLPSSGLEAAIIVALAGIVTAAIAYLLAERILRPSAARALAGSAPERLEVPGVATRAVLAWVLGTGVPVAGLVAIGIGALVGGSVKAHQLAIAIVGLGCVGLAVGLLAVAMAARATADPVDSVREALTHVQRGELDVHVPVYDGTQIGQLQLGFNRMVDGLAERERIRRVLGAYVDPDVAARILEEGTSLEGEEVEVTIMFIDVRNFTGFAERTPAREVVASMNRLFEQIVPIIHAHGGHVDKFIGDGLLAVFGAPRRLPNHADQALGAALEIQRVLQTKGPHDLQIGVGLNSGSVVAGNIGGAGRLEFTIIGDAVNTAARVEAATRQTGDTILISDRTKQLLHHPPALTERTAATLKGKTEGVRLFAPSSGTRGEARAPGTGAG
jgi:adenylate cyclase